MITPPHLFNDDYGWGPDGDPESPTPGCMFAIALIFTIAIGAYMAWKEIL